MLPQMDRHFGPTVPGRFDFTLLFELVMFRIVPAGIVILMTPMYMRILCCTAAKVRPGLLLCTKLAAAGVLAALQLTSVVLWHNALSFRSAITMAAPILSFISALCIITALYTAHTRFLQPSTFLSVFFSLTLLLDIAMARSCLMRHGLDLVGGIQIGIASMKLCLAFLEEISKRSLLRSEQIRASASPQDVSGFWTRALLLWVYPLLLRGFRGNLLTEDLPHLDEKFGSEQLFRRFTPQWDRVPKTSRYPLLVACVRALFWELVLPVLPRLCFIGFSFSRPFLMQRVIDTVSEGGTSKEVVNGLIGATILIFGGIMVSRSIYERLENQFNTCIRGMLIVAIYEKLQNLSMDDLEKSAAVTLMSTDVDGIQKAVSTVHNTWASLVELGLGIYVMYLFVGYAAFLIFIPTIIAAMASFYTTKRMAAARTTWNAKIESRVSITSNILAQLKSIKMMGLEKVVANYIQSCRAGEIKESRNERKSRVLVYAIYAFGNGMTPVVIFAGARFWTRASNPMTNAETFAAYAAIFIASLPLSSLLGRLPYFGSSFACFRRIEKFLLLEEKCDQREIVQQIGSGDCDKKPEESGARHNAVEIQNAVIQNESSKPIVKTADIFLAAGSFCMIRGAVGSGKSAFLKALLGELPLASGKIRVASKHIAYASQTPWVPNMTIQEAIIGANPFVQALYNEVVAACALDQDIASFPDGDKTMTGSNGCNLSGGQKQRLGLAFALFTGASIFVLDDVFSALDSQTALEVFQNLFGSDGLFRRWRSTVIMTTTRLEFFDVANVILQLDKDGQVVIHSDAAEPATADAVVAKIRQAAADSKSEGLESQLAEKSGPLSVGASQTVPKAVDKRQGSWKLYSYYLRSTGIFLLLLYFITTALAAAMERLPQIFMRIWLSTAPNDDTYFAGFAALSFGEIFMTAAGGALFLFCVIPNSAADLHWSLLQTVLNTTLQVISHTDSGSLLTRFSEDVGNITQQIPLLFMGTVSMGFNVLVDVGIVSSGSKYAPPLIVFLFIVLYAVQNFYLKTSRQLRLQVVEASAPLYTQFTETASGMAHIRGLNSHNFFHAKILRRVEYAQKPFFYLLSVQQWLTLILDFATFIAGITLTTISLKAPSSSSDNAIGLALLNLITFSNTASLLIQVWVSLETNLGSLARIEQFCANTPQQQNLGASAPPQEWPSTGRIELSNVTASYLGARGETRDAVLNASVAIEHGQRIGIKGRTGSGKSSLLLAILHLMEFSGTITIDGLDTKTIAPDILRSRITTLPQDGLEFKDTVRVNVYPFDTERTPTDDEVISVLELVGLWPYILQYGALDGNMAEIRLSQGQKQLFSLARAILHHRFANTKIVLVDEAISSVDHETSSRIHRLMKEAFVTCSVLLVAHREESFEDVDSILEIDSGSLAHL